MHIDDCRGPSFGDIQQVIDDRRARMAEVQNDIRHELEEIVRQYAEQIATLHDYFDHDGPVGVCQLGPCLEMAETKRAVIILSADMDLPGKIEGYAP